MDSESPPPSMEDCTLESVIHTNRPDSYEDWTCEELLQ